MNYEDRYIRPALEAAKACGLSDEALRQVNLALSVLDTNGSATSEEMRRELGNKWVIARRTKNIVYRYGDDVKTYSRKQYEMAELRAIEKRFP